MLTLNERLMSRVLVISAHPDDVDFGAAGTIAALTDAGVEVTYCLVTDGDAGGHDQTVPRPRMVEIRRAEQTAAAADVGVSELIFLGLPDGRVEFTLALRALLSRVIRRVRPDVVITQSPVVDLSRIYASHPDHVATGQAAMAAVYPDARNPFAFPELLGEGLEPWAVGEVWVMSANPALGGVLRAVDITATLERKISALMRHESQHTDPGGLGVRIRQRLRDAAAANGLPDGASAELFQVIDTA